MIGTKKDYIEGTTHIKYNMMHIHEIYREISEDVEQVPVEEENKKKKTATHVGITATRHLVHKREPCIPYPVRHEIGVSFLYCARPFQ